MPISISRKTVAVPPELKKGRVTPVVGIMLVTTIRFRITCRATWEKTPMARSLPNKSSACWATLYSWYSRYINIRITMPAPKTPSSSQTTAKIISL